MDLNTIVVGDCLDVMGQMADGCVQCVVTSPPYWGLRDYGNPPRVWDDGWSGCLGLEPTPELYVSHLVHIFREVKRVLRDDGTLWLNMGDSYWSDTLVRGTGLKKARVAMRKTLPAYGSFYKERPAGLKPKDLCGIPWRVAFALQADGWWLRSDIIWHKPNCMPESVRDRPTKAHEYVFLLSKSKRYYYDQDAVREAGEGDGRKRGRTLSRREYNSIARPWQDSEGDGGRNRRTVWTIPTQPYSGAHFAVFPEKLIEPCIKAGTSERGACLECGAGWVRVVERKSLKRTELPKDHRHYRPGFYTDGKAGDPQTPGPGQALVEVLTIGWCPTCICYNTKPFPKIPRQGKDNEETDEAYAKRIAPILAKRLRLLKKWESLLTQPCLTFDPFMGAGTTALVAMKLDRDFYGSEINPEYVALANERLDWPDCV